MCFVTSNLSNSKEFLLPLLTIFFRFFDSTETWRHMGVRRHGDTRSEENVFPHPGRCPVYSLLQCALADIASLEARLSPHSLL